MTDCCVPTDAAIVDSHCAGCGGQGLPVDRQTVRALLTPAALVRLESGPHRFCPDSTCDVVYFDDSGQTFLTADVREPVWQKQPFGSRLICYCFGETEATIRDELEAGARTMAVERVRAHIAAGRCACEIRNPRGACCLGDLIAAVARVSAAGVKAE